MRILFSLCFALLFGAALPLAAADHKASVAAAAAEPTGTGDASLQNIISGAEPIKLISEETLRGRLHADGLALKTWWSRESADVVLLLIGCSVILLAVAVSLIVLRRIKRKRCASGIHNWRSELFLSLSEPLVILFGLFGLFLFFVPVLRSLPEIYTCNVRFFFTLITLCIAWGGMELISVLSRRISDYAQRDDNNLDALLVDILRKLLMIVLILFTVFFIVQSIFNLNLTTWLTGAGVLGLAVAFASKESLSNFFGTLVIIGDKPFRCGDRVRIDGVDGIVANVGMRSTRLHTPDETVYLIPNSRIEAASIENISYRGVIRYVFTLGLVYESTADDMKTAMDVLHRLLDDFHGRDVDRYKPHIFFDSLGASSMNIKVIMWLKTSSFTQEESWRTEINLAIVREFAKAHLVLAFSTMTDYLYGDPAHPVCVQLGHANAGKNSAAES